MVWRDPDLGRERPTQALGRRAHNIDVHTAPWLDAQAPWSTRSTPLTRRDVERDRLAGIPPRDRCMWPAHAGRLAGPAEVAASIRAFADPAGGEYPAAEPATAALSDAAPTLAGRPVHKQRQILHDTAYRNRLDPAGFVRLAEGVGQTIAQRLHRSAGAVGSPALNALAGARLETLVTTWLARQRLLDADRASDPDLPRLWMLTNGMTHGVPGIVMATIPGECSGPESLVHPTRDELVGWHGARDALDAMDATVTAATVGRAWLLHDAADTAIDVLDAVGVVSLTAPRTAHRLLAQGAWRHGGLRLATVADAYPPPPSGPCDLSEAALHALCRRNGWLVGTPEEIVAREIVERGYASRSRPPLDDAERRSVADLGAGALVALAHRKLRWEADWCDHLGGPAGADPGRMQLECLLAELGRNAIARHSGAEIDARQGWADAVAHRWPSRAVRYGLRLVDPDRFVLDPAAHRAPTGPASGQLFDPACGEGADLGL